MSGRMEEMHYMDEEMNVGGGLYGLVGMDMCGWYDGWMNVGLGSMDE